MILPSEAIAKVDHKSYSEFTKKNTISHLEFSHVVSSVFRREGSTEDTSYKIQPTVKSLIQVAPNHN